MQPRGDAEFLADGMVKNEKRRMISERMAHMFRPMNSAFTLI
jgi:hypothetical protein